MALSGCSREAEVAAKPRPVKAVRIAADGGATTLTFSGEVRARYETKLAFRVAGKVLSRHVDVGDRVRRGQVLARLDTNEYQLAARALAAQRSAAQKDRDFAKDDVERYRDLLERKFISRAEFDRRETSFATANDRLVALEAQLKQSEDQVSYATLAADRDGAVTALFIEAGQVVTAGQPIVSLAQLDQKEALISVPEHELANIHSAQEASVTLWAVPDKPLTAAVREVAPSADAGSRTYSVRLSLNDAPAWVQLGMTANVSFKRNAVSGTTIPLPALFQPQGHPDDKPRVWVVNEATHTVSSVSVSLGEMVNQERVAVDGLDRGQVVVVAGVSRLREGQLVRLVEEPKPLTAVTRGVKVQATEEIATVAALRRNP
jgi:multidrug efflux system membrane fusion protein